VGYANIAANVKSSRAGSSRSPDVKSHAIGGNTRASLRTRSRPSKGVKAKEKKGGGKEKERGGRRKEGGEEEGKADYNQIRLTAVAAVPLHFYRTSSVLDKIARR